MEIKTVYVAEDGNVFDTADMCRKYEREFYLRTLADVMVPLRAPFALDEMLDDGRGISDYYSFKPMTDADVTLFRKWIKAEDLFVLGQVDRWRSQTGEDMTPYVFLEDIRKGGEYLVLVNTDSTALKVYERKAYFACLVKAWDGLERK